MLVKCGHLLNKFIEIVTKKDEVLAMPLSPLYSHCLHTILAHCIIQTLTEENKIFLFANSFARYLRTTLLCNV